MKMQASAQLELPLTAAALSAFLKEVPEHSEIKISTVDGGDQRDPYPVRYNVVATWDTTQNKPTINIHSPYGGGYQPGIRPRGANIGH